MEEKNIEEEHYDVIVLFSGGLDSLLTAKILEKQGLRVQCLHFISPFFGSASKAEEWAKEYNLTIEPVDISKEYCAMLYNPEYGYGKMLNPCIDCKIMMLKYASRYMKKIGASCVATGEVLGQRPMSQRKEALCIIKKRSGLEGYLLRPLTAKNLEPTIAENNGIVNREALYGLYGRSRTGQMELAKEFGITVIPPPAGGCSLTVAETARCYYPIIEYIEDASKEDYVLARAGRQFWNGTHWLIIGRNAEDNALLFSYRKPEDYYIEFASHIGAVALVRQYKGSIWSSEMLESAIFRMISFSPKVRVLIDETIEVCIYHAQEQKRVCMQNTINNIENAQRAWVLGKWEEMKKKAHRKEHIL